MLEKILIENIILKSGKTIPFASIAYQVFGQKLGSAPVVLVNHALTGNSNVSGENGWWKQLIDYNHIINLNDYTILAFNIPGNHFIEENAVVPDYKEITTKDIAVIFWEALFKIGVQELFAVIGGSLGGAIAWEMIALEPKKVQNVIPIATHYRSTDWVIANVHIQDEILSKKENPIQTARKHAMLLYRTPESINQRFQNAKEANLFMVEDWLDFHGHKLNERFTIEAYQQMNYLLKTIDVTQNGQYPIQEIISNFKGNIFAINVNTDLLFHVSHTAYQELEKENTNFKYQIINSIHGHDAFLMEYTQLNQILEKIFKKNSYANN